MLFCNFVSEQYLPFFRPWTIRYILFHQVILYPLTYISGNNVQDEGNEVHNDNVSSDGIQLLPTVGMSFDSADDVKTLYRKYDIQQGFGIRTRTSKKGPDNELRYIMLVCASASTYVSAIPTEVSTQPTQTVQCGAHITAGKKDGKWYIMFVNQQHSHELSPTKSRMFRGNKTINLQAKRTLDINDDAGVRINKTYRSLVSLPEGMTIWNLLRGMFAIMSVNSEGHWVSTVMQKRY